MLYYSNILRNLMKNELDLIYRTIKSMQLLILKSAENTYFDFKKLSFLDTV
jgi:hypothetical protein